MNGLIEYLALSTSVVARVTRKTWIWSLLSKVNMSPPSLSLACTKDDYYGTHHNMCDGSVVWGQIKSTCLCTCHLVVEHYDEDVTFAI